MVASPTSLKGVEVALLKNSILAVADQLRICRWAGGGGDLKMEYI